MRDCNQQIETCIPIYVETTCPQSQGPEKPELELT